jgi:hypothetical protein
MTYIGFWYVDMSITVHVWMPLMAFVINDVRRFWYVDMSINVHIPHRFLVRIDMSINGIH